MARVSQWNWSDFTQEWSQTAAINELDEELAAERSARFRQARQLEATQHEFKQGLKQVGSQIDSVSDRIEAVLDWTELRFQQVEFDEYQARKEIRNLVRALAEGRPTRSPDFDDVPGYWLPAAAAAVLPLVLRDRASIPAQGTAPNPFADLKTGLETARERDAIRAELFNLAVGRCFDQPAFIDAAVLRLLAEPSDLGVVEPGQVAAGWRTLWEQAALGAFGPGAEAQIASLLRERFAPEALDEETLAAWDAAIIGFGVTDEHQPTQAEVFAALEAHVAAEPGSADRPADGDAAGIGEEGLSESDFGTAARTGEPLGDDAALSAPTLDAARTGESIGDHATPNGSVGDDAARAGEPIEGDDAAWRSYLQELIEEPSRAELPLVRQMAELDPFPEGRESDRRSWTASAGSIADLVRRDLFDPETPVPLRRLALDLAAPVLRSRLDHLEASLGTTEKVTVTVRRRGELIEVTRDGHDPERFAAVERRIDAAFDYAAPSTAVTGAFVAGIGALALLMLFLGQWFLAALCAAVAVVPLWKHRTDAAKAAKQGARRDEQVAEARAALVEARKDAESEERARTERGVATRQALERLRSALPAEPGPTALSASAFGEPSETFGP